MRSLFTIGAILLALGIAGMIWGGIEYYQEREELEIGDVSLVVEDSEFPPQAIAGAVCAGLGVLALGAGAFGGRRK